MCILQWPIRDIDEINYFVWRFLCVTCEILSIKRAVSFCDHCCYVVGGCVSSARCIVIYP